MFGAPSLSLPPYGTADVRRPSDVESAQTLISVVEDLYPTTAARIRTARRLADTVRGFGTAEWSRTGAQLDAYAARLTYAARGPIVPPSSFGPAWKAGA